MPMTDHLSAACTVVAIGASAGGVEALRALFQTLQPGAGLSFVVQLHLDPQAGSALTEIIARVSRLRVVTATDGALLEPDHVLVVPPGVTASITNRRVFLTHPQTGQRHPHSVDILLASLALDQKERAVGIILSGMGDDGTLGCKAIQEKGGLTIAQAITDAPASHREMPDNAAKSGFIDFVLPVSEIAANLTRYAQAGTGLAELNADEAEEELPRDDAEHKLHGEICVILYRVTGHDFSGYKERGFMRRVKRRMQILLTPDLQTYVARLKQDRAEVEALFHDCLISVTSFFRDPMAFEALAAQVIPALFKSKTARDTVRVWVPACATGEEAYSIAILLLEYAKTLPVQPRLLVFATDIDEAGVRAARAGRYTAAEMGGLSRDRLERFFSNENGIFTVAKELRESCVFSSHSLVRDPPFSQLDLVSCRNLLIYLDSTVQREIFPLFHFALRPGGFLLLGGAESAEQFSGLFKPIDKNNRIYQRRDEDAFPLQLPLRRSAVKRERTGHNARQSVSPPDAKQMAEILILNRFSPPHVVVNRDWDIVHFSARTGPYLEPPAGQPTRNLISLARLCYRLELRAALDQAARTGKAATRLCIDTVESKQTTRVLLTVEPLPAEAGPTPMFLVVFGAPEPVATTALATVPNQGDTPLLLAEHETSSLREQLQSLIEDHEKTVAELSAANEELMSINEEYQSTTEELETSKEEQQSINEELQTVNQELQAKLDDLDRANLDLRNLFEATEIATVTLDKAQRIKGFSPAMTHLLNLLPSDIGRPLSDITGAVNTAAILRDADAVIKSGQMIEQKLTPFGGNAHFICRTFPYRSADGALEGALVSFVNVTQLVEAVAAVKRSQEEAERLAISQAELDRVLMHAPLAVYRGFVTHEGTLSIEYLSHGIEAMTGWSAKRLSDPAGLNDIVTLEKQARAAEELRTLLAQGSHRDSFQLRRADGSLMWVRTTQAVIGHDPRKGTEVAGFIADITEEQLVNARTISASRLASLGEMAAGLAHELKQPLQSILMAANMADIFVEKTDAAAIRKQLIRITSQAERGAAIIESLRAFAAGGDKVTVTEPVALETVIADTLVLVSGPLIEAGITLTQERADGPLMVLASRLELEQVLVNLLLNARDALSALPPDVTRRIVISALRDEAAGVVRLCVADNGGGVTAAMVPRLFEPFQTTKGPDKGTGLGLSICRGLLKARGGDIAHHNGAEGAIFTVTLPDAPAAPATPLAAAHQA